MIQALILSCVSPDFNAELQSIAYSVFHSTFIVAGTSVGTSMNAGISVSPSVSSVWFELEIATMPGRQLVSLPVVFM